MNFFNNMMGVAAPVITGYAVSASGTYTLSFLIAGIVLLVGIVSYVFVLGRLEPIPERS
jgi:dipeptide/tripeptide permease